MDFDSNKGKNKYFMGARAGEHREERNRNGHPYKIVLFRYSTMCKYLFFLARVYSHSLNSKAQYKVTIASIKCSYFLNKINVYGRVYISFKKCLFFLSNCKR
jgi:hypothetical protein